MAAWGWGQYVKGLIFRSRVFNFFVIFTAIGATFAKMAFFHKRDGCVGEANHMVSEGQVRLAFQGRDGLAFVDMISREVKVFDAQAIGPLTDHPSAASEESMGYTCTLYGQVVWPA